MNAVSNSAVQHMLLEVERAGDGLHVFSLNRGIANQIGHARMTPPLLTCSAGKDELVKLVECFAAWDGAVKIAALLGEGLLDVWIE